MNYLTLQGRVEDELLRTDLSVNIGTWINEARSEIADGTLPVLATDSQGIHRFEWTLTARSSVGTSIAVNAWPSDFIEEKSLFFRADEKPLPPLTTDEYYELAYQEIYSLTGTGDPKHYVKEGANYRLVPTPDGAKLLYLDYYAYPVDLTAAADEEEIDTQVPSLIIATACLKGARYLRDKPMVEGYKEQVVEYYMAAKNKDRMQKFRGRDLRMKSYSDRHTSLHKGRRNIY